MDPCVVKRNPTTNSWKSSQLFQHIVARMRSGERSTNDSYRLCHRYRCRTLDRSQWQHVQLCPCHMYSGLCNISPYLSWSFFRLDIGTKSIGKQRDTERTSLILYQSSQESQRIEQRRARSLCDMINIISPSFPSCRPIKNSNFLREQEQIYPMSVGCGSFSLGDNE